MSAPKKYLEAEKIVGDIKRIDVFEKAPEEVTSPRQIYTSHQARKNLLTGKSLICPRPMHASFIDCLCFGKCFYEPLWRSFFLAISINS